MSEQAAVRLDLVLHRRDRLVEASAVWLFLALVIYIFWMIVLVLFVGILEAPWLSLVPGLIGTALLLRWGVFLSRGSLNRARGPVPHLLVSRDEITICQLFDPGDPIGSLRVPRSSVDVIVVEAPADRQRRAGRVRFPVFSDVPEPVGWLYCPDDCTIPPLGLLLGRGRTPNVLVLTSAPDRGSFIAELADPDTAGAIFGSWPVRPQVQYSDAERWLQNGLLPVIRRGTHGLREVRHEDRIRARLIDGFTLLVLMLLVLLRFVPPSLGNVVGAFLLTWFLLEVPATARSGLTLGKFLIGLRVVRIEDCSERVGVARATTRWRCAS